MSHLIKLSLKLTNKLQVHAYFKAKSQEFQEHDLHEMNTIFQNQFELKTLGIVKLSNMYHGHHFLIPLCETP